jgi:cytochrome c peroxidase
MKRGLALLLILGCRARAASEWSVEERAILEASALPVELPASEGNAVADDPRAAALGHRLFFDRGLSTGATRACADCHVPARYFADGLPRARTSFDLERNTPSLIGAAWAPFLGWDGRSDSVWAHSIVPLLEAREHGLSTGAIVDRIAEAHRRPYEELFGPIGRERSLHVAANAGKALEAYLRKLAPRPAAFDRWVAALSAGDPRGGGHLDDLALRGLRIFLREGRCVSCHHGPLFTDGEFHNLGLPSRVADEGRARGIELARASPFRCGGGESDGLRCDPLRFAAHGRPELLGAFRTPSLRNVAETAPYMHDGSLPTLGDVVAFYRDRPAGPPVGVRDPLVETIDRRLDVDAIVAFLRALTGPLPESPWLAPPP